MGARNEWITNGITEGVFMLVGSLQPGLGGWLLTHNTTRSALDVRLNADPFVADDVVSVEVLEVGVAKTDPETWVSTWLRRSIARTTS